jgi:AcrR family transcriptional regulator
MTLPAEAAVDAGGPRGSAVIDMFAVDRGAWAAETTRRRLTAKQAAVVDRLVDATEAEARERGYDGMTVRSTARRAGVAPATAYTYFASKDHLLAEVLWRHFQELPEPVVDEGAGTPDRVAAALRVLGLFMADEPEIAAACTTALLGSGPDVRALRVRFGAQMHARMVAALGDDTDRTVLLALDLAYSGAMLWAGMGHISFSDVPGALTDVALALLKDR